MRAKQAIAPCDEVLDVMTSQVTYDVFVCHASEDKREFVEPPQRGAAGTKPE